jgi:hypothetical protein
MVATPRRRCKTFEIVRVECQAGAEKAPAIPPAHFLTQINSNQTTKPDFYPSEA